MYVRGVGGFTNQGVINVSNGDLFGSNLAVSGTGTIALSSGGVVNFTTAVASGQVISFVDGAADRLTLLQPSSFAGSVRNFQPDNTIDE